MASDPRGGGMLIKCLKCMGNLEFMQFYGDKDGLEVYICPKCGAKIGLDFTTEEAA